MSSPKLEIPTRDVPHPDLPLRKRIAARMLVVRGLDVEGWAPDDEDRTVDRRMRREGYEAADDPYRVRDGRSPLDAHLRRTSGVMRDVGARAVTSCLDRGAPSPSLPTRVEHGLRREERAVDCARCGQALGHVCDGTERDHLVMRADPECWRTIRDLLRFASTETARVYGLVSPEFAEGPQCRIFFGTRADRRPTPEAKTCFPIEDDGAHRHAEVALALPSQDLGHDGYFGLAYQLFHEVFVHVPQAYLTPGRRRPFGSDCPLTEGMLDEAAYRTMRTALGEERSLGTLVPDSMVPHLETFSRRAEEQRIERGRRVLENDDPSAPNVRVREARAFGRSLFEKLANRRSGSDGEEWAVALAIRLNVGLASGSARTRVALGMQEALRPPRNDRKVDFLAALDEVVDKGLNERTLTALGLG